MVYYFYMVEVEKFPGLAPHEGKNFGLQLNTGENTVFYFNEFNGFCAITNGPGHERRDLYVDEVQTFLQQVKNQLNAADTELENLYIRAQQIYREDSNTFLERPLFSDS